MLDEQPVATPEPPAPQLADDIVDDGILYRNISVASTDPIETCRRSVHALVMITFDPHNLSFVSENGNTYYRPKPILERFATELGDKIGETCAGTQWPELYVVCEGTKRELNNGIATCYPYDGFE